jgi:FkbM family methyltransferase
MNLFENFRTVLRDPALGREYGGYLWSKLLHGGHARLTLASDVRLGGFSGFSEYHSCARFISAAERDFFYDHPFPEGSFIDVGANLGVVTLNLARRFPERPLYAFEPNPSTFRALESNLLLNRLPHVRAHQAAVAAEEGEVQFEAAPLNRGTTHIVKGAGKDVITVPCVALDRFAEREGLGEIAFLKVDVEGYETLVFQGAADLIGNHGIALVYYEICPELARLAGFDPQGPSRFLLERDYRLHTLNPDGSLRPVSLDRISQIESDNWIALAP